MRSVCGVRMRTCLTLLSERGRLCFPSLHCQGKACEALLPGVVIVGELVPVCRARFVLVLLHVPLMVLYGDRFVVDGVEAVWMSEGAGLGVFEEVVLAVFPPLCVTPL